jgi:hypothetical protein
MVKFQPSKLAMRVRFPLPARFRSPIVRAPHSVEIDTRAMKSSEIRTFFGYAL